MAGGIISDSFLLPDYSSAEEFWEEKRIKTGENKTDPERLENGCPLRFGKFASRSLKGKGAKTGLRLIYKFEVEIKTIDLIEIYFKGNKENEDRER